MLIQFYYFFKKLYHIDVYIFRISAMLLLLFYWLLEWWVTIHCWEIIQDINCRCLTKLSVKVSYSSPCFKSVKGIRQIRHFWKYKYIHCGSNTFTKLTFSLLLIQPMMKLPFLLYNRPSSYNSTNLLLSISYVSILQRCLLMVLWCYVQH